ncbi:putative uncharacterized protein DDB_G0289263 [Oppia nitens]|uniref:putative uncharacterized protein DDB_G0289263 n=1 Tax=Oppia nitens TaxID=1686743 RepID=UPI0023DB1AB5|nr:putative uncharacterized protein DDB_G0289263 [Oppia nitens]
MLIETQPQQSTTPPTPQLVINHNQSMISPSTPHNIYNIPERVKQRVGKYRQHHQLSYQKNEVTVEAQNMKMREETARLQQQFHNNNTNNSNNKSKQQKSLNSAATQRTANKRSNASTNSCDNKCESNDIKPTKMAKVTNNRLTNSSTKNLQLSSSNQSFGNNSKFNTKTNQMDIKVKPLITSTCVPTNSCHIIVANNSIPEIKREIEDNGYFQSVTVDAIDKLLYNTSNSSNGSNNNNAINNMDVLGTEVMKDLFNDPSLTDDVGDEDFIAKFLEDLNDPTFSDQMSSDFCQSLNTAQSMSIKPIQHQLVNHSNVINVTNNSINNIGINGNANIITGNTIINSNQINFNANNTNMQSNAYHPIQPRLQPNMVSNIANRSSLQINNVNNTNFTPISISNNNTVRNNYANVNTRHQIPPQQQQQLLLQQIPQQQPLNNIQVQQQPPQGVRMNVPTGSVPRMAFTMVPKTENNMSVRLSIQVPQQHNTTATTGANAIPSQITQTSTQASQAAANASIKLKQMAQQAQQMTQQKTQQWVINHSNQQLSQITQNAPQVQQQQQTPPPAQHLLVQQSQRLLVQTPQQRQPQQMVVTTDTQNITQMQSQSQNYFNQQIYWF